MVVNRNIGVFLLASLLTLSAVFVTPFTGFAQADMPSWERVASAGGSVTALEYANGLVYAGEGSTLTIYQVDDAGQLTLLSSLTLPELVEDIAMANNTAYLALGAAGFYLVDVSNPAAPLLREHLPLFSPDPEIRWLARAVDVVGGVAALVVGTRIQEINAASGGFLWLLVQSAPDAVVFSPPVALSGYPSSIHLTGDYAYVTTNSTGQDDGGLAIIAAQIPTSPVLLSTVPNPSSGRFANAVYVAGTIAYVAGLGVVDVRDPAAPVLLPSGDINELNGTDLQVVGNTLYLVSNGRLEALDISDPTNPTPSENGSGFVFSPLLTYTVAASARWVFVGSDAGLSIYGPTPLQLAAVDQQGGSLQTLVHTDGLVYVGGGGSGEGTAVGRVQVFAAPPDGQLTRLNTAIINDFVYDLQVVDDLLAVSQLSQLIFLQRDAAHALPQIGSYRVGQIPFSEAHFAGERAYLIEGSFTITSPPSNLLVFDPTNRTALTAISRIPLPGTYYDLTVVGTTAYLVGQDESDIPMLRVFDISNPNRPSEIGSLALQRQARTITVAGSRAYIGGAVGLAIVDVSNPSTPLLMSELFGLNVQDVLLVGNTAYLAAREYNLVVVDVRDPAAPFQITELQVPGSPTELQRVGDLLYIAAGNGGLQVVRIGIQ